MNYVRVSITQYIGILTPLFIVLIMVLPLQAELVDKVVAVVNEDVITLSELDEEGKMVFQRITAVTPPANLQAKLAKAREDILNTLIDKRLIAQLAATKSISVSEKEIDEAMARVQRRSQLSNEEFVAKLKQSGLSEEVYRTTLKSQILQNKLISADVQNRVVITEAMIKKSYENSYTSKVESGGYYLRQMGFSWQDRNASRPAVVAGKLDAKNRAEKVHALAKGGKDFAALARQYSDLPSADDGGDIGVFELDEMAVYMRQAVADLKAGEISEIIETPSGYQFFKLLNAAEDGVLTKVPYEDVKEDIRQELFDEEMKKAYGQWVKKLKEEAYIQKL